MLLQQRINFKRFVFFFLIFSLISIVLSVYHLADADNTNNGLKSIIAKKGLSRIVMRENKGNCSLPYHSGENTFYYPISLEQEGKRISINVTALLDDIQTNYKIDDILVESTVDLIVDFDKKYAVDICRDNFAYTAYLQFTCIPIVTLNTIEEIEMEEDVFGSITLIDPYHKDDNKDYVSFSYVYMHTRGDSSLAFDKKNYKLKLINNNGCENYLDLLGMRSNCNWALDSLYNDPSKIRNKLSSSIWSEIANDNLIENGGSQLAAEFCEVFLNGEYVGLYYLKELIDYQKLNVKEHTSYDSGMLIKGISYLEYSYEEPGDTSRNIWTSFELKYPQNITYAYNMYWSVFCNHLDSFLKDDRDIDAYFADYFYTGNYIDYYIFINFINGQDNIIKNLYLSMNSIYSDPRLRLSPWDLDLTFGLAWDADSDLLSKYEYDTINALYSPLKIAGLIFTKHSTYIGQMKDKYNYLRKHILAYENIESKINSYLNLLIKSNATQRDSTRWYKYDIEQEISDIKEFMKRRITFLDSYINKLS